MEINTPAACKRLSLIKRFGGIVSFLKSVFKLQSASYYMPVICEYTALFLPKVKQEATQNHRQKDRKEPRQEGAAGSASGSVTGMGGNLFQDFPGFTTDIVVWAEKQVPVTGRLPPFWAYRCPASPGSSAANITFFSCFGSQTEGTYSPCAVCTKIARAASPCFRGDPASPSSCLGNSGTYFKIWDCHLPWG